MNTDVSWRELLQWGRDEQYDRIESALASPAVQRLIFREDKYGHSLFGIWAGFDAMPLLAAVEQQLGDDLPWTPPNAAAWGRLAVLKRQFEVDQLSLKSLMHIALRHGRLEVAVWLIQQGVDLSQDEGDGYVRSATFGRQPDGIRFAVSHGAAVDYLPEGVGETALYHEAKHGRWRMVPTLLEQGADPDFICPATQQSPRQIATESNRSKKLINLLNDFLGG